MRFKRNVITGEKSRGTSSGIVKSVTVLLLLMLMMVSAAACTADGQIDLSQLAVPAEQLAGAGSQPVASDSEHGEHDETESGDSEGTLDTSAESALRSGAKSLPEAALGEAKAALDEPLTSPDSQSKVVTSELFLEHPEHQGVAELLATETDLRPAFGSAVKTALERYVFPPEVTYYGVGYRRKEVHLQRQGNRI